MDITISNPKHASEETKLCAAQRVKPPFPVLPSFLVAANVLSFYGDSE